MKLFFKKLVLFTLLCITVATAYYFVSKLIRVKAWGINSTEQVYTQFKYAREYQYEGLALGSSLLYRGLNPDSLTSFRAFNFAHDNDSYNQFYYKMQLVKESKKNIKYLIIGVDYFNLSRLVSNRNHIYSKLLPSSYMDDYKEEIENNFFNSVNDNIKKFMDGNYSKTLVSLIVNSGKLIKGSPSTRILKENGHYVLPTYIAHETEKTEKAETYQPLQLQLNYLDKLVTEGLRDSMNIFLVFPPVRKYILDYPSEIEKQKIDSIIEYYASKPNVHYLNYSNDDRFIMSDFQDYIHLNQNGSNKFSSFLNTDIKKVLND